MQLQDHRDLAFHPYPCPDRFNLCLVDLLQVQLDSLGHLLGLLDLVAHHQAPLDLVAHLALRDSLAHRDQACPDSTHPDQVCQDSFLRLRECQGCHLSPALATLLK